MNENPGGCEMLRPLVKNKEKDTAENAVIAIKRMEGDIKLLKDTIITSTTRTEIRIKHMVIHSMHDGKNRYDCVILDITQIYPRYNII